jgi:hypothetical protein
LIYDLFQGSTEVIDEKCDVSDKESIDSATSSTSKDGSPVKAKLSMTKGRRKYTVNS